MCHDHWDTVDARVVCRQLGLPYTGNKIKLPAKYYSDSNFSVVVSSGGAPTPAGTSVFTKHNWDMGMGYLWLNGWGIYHLMGGAFIA